MTKNATVTFASGVDFCRSAGFRTYINSLKNIKNSAFFVLTCDMPNDIRFWLQEKNIHVVDIQESEVWLIIRDRHLAFSNWLNQNDQYDLYLFTDCKDVIFQNDPFEWHQYYGYEIVLVEEGFYHSDSLWNMQDQARTQFDCKNFKKNMANRPVINGGIIIGKGQCLKYHFLMLWSFNLRSVANDSDQGSLNYLFNWLETWPEYYVSQDLCLTGESAKIKSLYVFEDNKFLNQYGNPYCIVHQWDRLPEAERIINYYAKS